MENIITAQFGDICLERSHIVPGKKGLMICWLISEENYFLVDDSGGKQAIFDYLILDNFKNEFGALPKFAAVAIISNTDFYKVFTALDSNSDNTSRQSTDLADSIDALFENAIMAGASDIHFVRNDQVAVISLRVNGLLTRLKTISSESCDEMMFVSYNILATTKESTWNRNIPQDANILRELPSGSYRFRYAHMPIFGSLGGCYHAVLRIIKAEAGEIFDVVESKNPLEILQLSADEQQDLQLMMQSPHGLLLITGVTGSGKSTTIKNVLEWMYNKKYGRNACFVTVEDPVEYRIMGAIQSSVVRLKADVNPFLPALKSAMRRDPDVLMIGETRDGQTATALTGAIESGHYAVTTVHAGSVTTAIQRLESLGVKKDRLASPGFIAGIITQTLIPTLCEHCKIYCTTDCFENQLFTKNESGCEKCKYSGTSGRRPVFEMLVPDLNILQEITAGNPTRVYTYWRDKHKDQGKLNQGYLMKEKIFILVMEGLVDYQWFIDFYGAIDETIMREMHEKITNQ
ncbi:Flp pilus assembly complex ATPase component TadA [Shewanella sp. VB17]|uniref:ATPase, T2SS/T4P/T4SS family n=1 Tax=Shewanella sp. VB17 TaxID=2739432 RepID=UPI001563DCF9|nr:ATPase, T2SS/T4P/T4SS family [Shewanella sp. VB17]NRD72909.1 Flp pilus assembly complex ATPase component TadA [Shewanella sp. VB17]